MPGKKEKLPLSVTHPELARFLSNGNIAGKFDGYSEAWSKFTFEVKSIKELMRLTEEFEEGKNGK
ncbi:hypothetical protein [Candidatus Planktophila dulcis]|uniref:hypothetical protein n=1 Tax=Candidatus Planktophila dulcis TaxID=1884914 RepID=UPI003CF753B9